MLGFLYHPLSLAYLPTLPLKESESPLLLPSISKLEPLPLKTLTFNFPSHVSRNRAILERCTNALHRIDSQISRLNSNEISQKMAQATSQTYENNETPSTWKRNVEDTFHTHIMKRGFCPRDLYADHIDNIEKWLLNLANILELRERKQTNFWKTSLLLKN